MSDPLMPVRLHLKPDKFTHHDKERFILVELLNFTAFLLRTKSNESNQCTAKNKVN